MRYRNVLHAVGKIAKQEGLRGLYKGFGCVAFFTIPAHAFYFGGYDLTKRFLAGEKDKEGPLVYLISANVANFSRKNQFFTHFLANEILFFFGQVEQLHGLLRML